MKPKPIQKDQMDRVSLKAIVKQLKDAGSSIKVLKSDTDEILQNKLNDTLQKLPTEEISKQLESLVPEKLQKILKRDCLGVFIDLSDVSCTRCADVQTCVREYITNCKGDGIAKVVSLLAPAPAPAPAAAPAAVKREKKIVYDPDRLVFIKNMKNPNPKSDPSYKMLSAILDDVPSTMSELHEIVARYYDQTDEDFLALIKSLRAVGMIKLDVDLSEENKAELRAAGVEI